MSFFGLVLIGASAFLLNENMNFPGWVALVPTIGSALILSGNMGSWINKYFLGNKLASSIGLISYPLYLWHWPILVFLKELRVTPTTIEKALALALAFILSIGTYWLIEKPIRFKKAVRIRTLVFAMFLCVIAGAVTVRTDGLTSRYIGFDAIDLTNFDQTKYWPFHSCYMQADMGDTDIPNRAACIKGQGNKTILVWGDSFAAAFYSGLYLQPDLLTIRHVLLAANSCPPLMNWGSINNQNCPEINKGTLSFIREHKPDIVILHANWASPPPSVYPLDQLRQTIRILKQAGIQKIILVGMPPTYSSSLSKILLNETRKDNAVPERISIGVEREKAKDNDLLLSKIASDEKIDFISAFDQMCDSSTCLARIGSGQWSIASFDAGHLTPTASAWLIKKIEPFVLEK
ncbi:MAG: acyltransferase [Proteobacteria bacterium]|nr:acyltransferase [Pseudomonadota bacterium]